jgi:hypothetical protein
MKWYEFTTAFGNAMQEVEDRTDVPVRVAVPQPSGGTWYAPVEEVLVVGKGEPAECIVIRFKE